MIRTFRVSVSDRYPVKIDKWKDLGTYEARNSREIQAFLIENPLIWARYLRIEFLTHYGNEYYCPLSLIRVHGTRMLESWKETEANSDDDDQEENNGAEGEQYVPEAVAEVVQELEKPKGGVPPVQNISEDLDGSSTNISEVLSGNAQSSFSAVENNTPWRRSIFDEVNMPEEVICRATDTPSEYQTFKVSLGGSSSEPSSPGFATESRQTSSTSSKIQLENSISTSSTTSSSTQVQRNKATDNTLSAHSSTTLDPRNTTKTSDTQESSSISSTSSSGKQQNITSSQKITTISSASASLPTIQESFFKAVSRRLQLLESNSTLSLKYIEEQSKMLRDAFSKVEKKQLQKTAAFIDSLNATVFTELHGIRQQYDEIWQSTVISLESQREESHREILAISARLNILADEVVFQKRMSIIQSILLLLCLGLVIFSRVAGPLEFPNFQSSRTRILSGLSPDSPPYSPEYLRVRSLDDEPPWISPRRRQGSDDSALSPTRSHNGTPGTPISGYSRSDNGLASRIARDGPDTPENSDSASFSEARKSWRQSENGTSDPSRLQMRPHSRRSPSLRKSSGQTQNNSTGLIDDQQPLDIHERLVENSHSLEHTDSFPFSSPPPEEQDLSIARKPLPALPTDGDEPDPDDTN